MLTDLSECNNGGLVISNEPEQTAMSKEPISFGHYPWPNCTVHLIASDADLPEYPGLIGSGFFVQRGARVYLLTAGHCLVTGEPNTEDFLAKAAKVAAGLVIPIDSADGTTSRGSEGLVRFSAVSSVKVDNTSGAFFGSGKEGTLDVVALEVDPCQVALDARIRDRSVRLPPTGEWFIKSMDLAEKHSQKVPLVASGFPKQGTESSIDYDTRVVISQGIHLPAYYIGSGPWPHTHSLEVRQSNTRIELDGMSGGPIYMKARNGDDAPYYLVGMALRGGHGSDLIHFCTVDWLTGAIDAEDNRSTAIPGNATGSAAEAT